MFSRKDANDFLGVINLNYMIPYLASEVTLLDVDNIQDHKYKNLLQKQHEYIKISKEEISSKATKLHDLVRNKKQDHFVSISCDFDALENALKSFQAT